LKQGSTEKLVGRWRGYRPNGCGTGSTELERKTLTRVAAPKSSQPAAKKTTPPATKSKTVPQQGLTQKPKTVSPSTPRPAPKNNPP
ncbi:MAG TPA: hypothetical protein PLL71_15675, partial [Agriterribacter sp.]|nr:hypothetical protein [Agriterribacter sp.]